MFHILELNFVYNDLIATCLEMLYWKWNERYYYYLLPISEIESLQKLRVVHVDNFI